MVKSDKLSLPKTSYEKCRIMSNGLRNIFSENAGFSYNYMI